MFLLLLLVNVQVISEIKLPNSQYSNNCFFIVLRPGQLLEMDVEVTNRSELVTIDCIACSLYIEVEHLDTESSSNTSKVYDIYDTLSTNIGYATSKILPAFSSQKQESLPPVTKSSYKKNKVRKLVSYFSLRKYLYLFLFR